MFSIQFFIPDHSKLIIDFRIYLFTDAKKQSKNIGESLLGREGHAFPTEYLRVICVHPTSNLTSPTTLSKFT